MNPADRLLVIDAMTGQDAVNAAKAFNDALELTGVIITKLDGDTRGGAALSVEGGYRKAHKVLRQRRKAHRYRALLLLNREWQAAYWAWGTL